MEPYSLNPLEWYNFIFAGPLLLAIIFGILQVAGGESDEDGGVDADNDHSSNVFALLGLDKIPIFLGITTLLLLFGVVGYSLNSILLSGEDVPIAMVIINVVIAVVLSISGTRLITPAIAKILPSDHTRHSKSDLIGMIGHVSTTLTPGNPGYVNISKHGLTDTVKAILEGSETELVRNSRVCLVDYDPETEQFICTPFTEE